ncbi:hypothetical protein [Cytobacillus oceanisediminis]|uniref:hypothetical protein n=1 Tax=Cytobacillus oceanisediminis TaxID=665099 RepID=UPI001C22EC26|nr:hypothetical protein [Cytobacillus oceanisediminis]MBU8770342.1 hypothetical protein [Cytobacillus oceanisediminis]
MEHVTFYVKALLGVVLTFIFFGVLYNVVYPLVEPVVAVVVGGAFGIALLIIIFMFFVNIKDFIVSIFKDDDTRNEKGFKKNL